MNVCEETAKRQKSTKLLGFEDAAELCFEHGHPWTRRWGPFMGRLVTAFVTITQCGFCCIYFVFISTNIKQVWDNHFPDAPLSAVMAVVLVPMIILSWLTDLKKLAPISAVGNVLMLTGVLTVIVVALMDLPDISERRLMPLSVDRVSLFFGTIVYSFEGIGLVTPIKKRCKNPEKFAAPFGPLNVSMTVIMSILMTIGFLGYWRWGDEVKSTTTLNLDAVLGEVIQIIICVAVLITYPLQLAPAITNSFSLFRRKFGTFRRPILTELIFRTCLTLLLFTLAEVIPHLTLFISLNGALSATTLALVIPPIIETATFYEDYGYCYWRIWKNLAIFLFGILGFSLGTYFSLREIVNSFQDSSES